MFAIKTESIKSYVETPKSLLKEHRNLIALIAIMEIIFLLME